MQQNQWHDDKATFARWAGLGIEFGGVIAVFCFIGYLLDQKFDTNPLFLLIFFFLAFIGMFYNIWKQTRNLRGK